MKYSSTRDKSAQVSASKAIAQGISSDGGLFVPISLPSYTLSDIQNLIKLDYNGMAEKIFSDFLDDFSTEEIHECVAKAYTEDKFGSSNPAPLSCQRYGNNDINILELWHGPTSAFKDMALQILPHLLTKSLKKTSPDKEAVILVATSGDTGKAALEGFKDVPDTKIIVFYPVDGVSPMQKRQMNTQQGGNVDVCAIEGNFDDAQTAVKAIFTNKDLVNKLEKSGYTFSSANSINWGRLLPQIVYYFSAYSQLVSSGKVSFGESMNVVVPTGNFGNILAAYYAYRMGLPINKFICASNSNNVLTDFLNTGVYNKNREFYTTISPSMDILVSSNLERFLYHMTGEDETKINKWMDELKANGTYAVDENTMKNISELFVGGCCDEDGTKRTIDEFFNKYGYLCDTHTAVAVSVYNDYVERTGDKTPTVLDSTASPYKFSGSVLSAIANGEQLPDDEFAMVDMLVSKSGVPAPLPLAQLRDKQTRFSTVCAPADMPAHVLSFLGIE